MTAMISHGDKHKKRGTLIVPRFLYNGIRGGI